MDYIDIVEIYLETYGSITHREIIQLTNGNCPYTTLRGLKRRKSLHDEWVTNLRTKKRYKRYYQEAV